MTSSAKPITYQADLTKLPRALAPLIERQQWAVWRWTPVNGGWSKPPFQVRNPQQHASTKDPSTWADYATALAIVQAGHADGLTYVLTEQDSFAALDLDHCRTVETGSVEHWAQHMLARALHSYCEITPSGCGLRIWGTATGNVLHRKFALDCNADAAVELFRRTNKALTITGLDLGQGRTLGSLDQLLDWAVIFAGRHKPEPPAPAPAAQFNGGGSKYSIDAIENAIRTGTLLDGTPSRSECFHIVVGHLAGCGWSSEQILAHLEQFPDGIGERYLGEGRLSGEIARSLSKYNSSRTLFDAASSWTGPEAARLTRAPLLEEAPEPNPEEAPSELELELEQPAVPADTVEEDEELLEEEIAEAPPPDPNLPQLFCYGDPDPRPLQSWLIKGIMIAKGHGLLSGQWGTYKTFVALDIAGAVMSGQPFIGHMVKRQCGVLYLAAEGEDEIRLRIEALMHAKYGGPAEVPFVWYESVPILLQKGAADLLVKMAQRANQELQNRFGLPLGLLILDTITASAGYSTPGAENDAAVCQALMNTLKAAAPKLSCFCLGIDHLGKNPKSGTRGSSSKEASADLVLTCLGERELGGQICNTRFAVRKNRGGPTGIEVPYTVRKIDHPTQRDEDGELLSTLVIDWQLGSGTAPSGAKARSDPWQQFKRNDQRESLLRLRKVLMDVLADRGVDLPVDENGPIVRMVDMEIVREQFYVRTPADGSTKQKADFRRQKFFRAMGWAEEKSLIGIREIGNVTYLWLTRPKPPTDEDDEPEAA